MMTDIAKAQVSPEQPLREVLEAINASGLRVALVAGADGRLLGVITDGDVRRALTGGAELTTAAEKVMNPKPLVGRVGDDPRLLDQLLRERGLLHIPLLDAEGRVVRLHAAQERGPARLPNPAVIMAGGLGSRLRHLTAQTPKPMLPVGGKPLLERIVADLAAQGFRDIFLSVNYRAEIIEAHFEDGGRWGVNITYLREPKRLGTAGALSLLPELPAHPMLVMNGDLLTKLDFRQLLAFHEQQRAQATMGVREHQMQVPYGVIELDGHKIVCVREKPTESYLVNAGVYVLDPDVRTLTPPDCYFDMPELFQRMLEEGRPVAAYPIETYWLDIGHIADYERANGDFGQEFG